MCWCSSCHLLGALQAPYSQATLCMNLINLAMTSGLLDVDCAVIMAAELEAMTRTVATPALSFFPCYDHLGIFPSYLWLQDHYHLWTSLWLWSDCKSNGPFMVFVLLPLRMAACAKSGTIAVWFSFFCELMCSRHGWVEDGRVWLYWSLPPCSSLKSSNTWEKTLKKSLIALLPLSTSSAVIPTLMQRFFVSGKDVLFRRW